MGYRQTHRQEVATKSYKYCRKSLGGSSKIGQSVDGLDRPQAGHSASKGIRGPGVLTLRNHFVIRGASLRVRTNIILNFGSIVAKSQFHP
jgi:hypothetical protein